MMKTTTLIKNVLLIGFVSTAMIFTSCKREKDTGKPANEDAELMSIPCQSEGRSDSEFFRADASATSQDMNLSREKALTASKQRLAGFIETKIKSVTDRYVNETEFGENSQFESKFENLTREVVKQKLVDVAVTCEETYKETNNKFTTYLAIEVNKDAMLNGINNSLTQNQKLQVDYDKQKFEEIFNEEMEQMEEDRP
ncbi:MAG: hypothetical protein PF590_00735 [Candidatus Delongbacteria bacterium]|jgi:hypothetical protein|nr:hypothetical protein [Candidatus Delongbacteria bacterium]